MKMYVITNYPYEVDNKYVVSTQNPNYSKLDVVYTKESWDPVDKMFKYDRELIVPTKSKNLPDAVKSAFALIETYKTTHGVGRESLSDLS
jgi:hypothetical protein